MPLEYHDNTVTNPTAGIDTYAKEMLALTGTTVNVATGNTIKVNLTSIYNDTANYRAEYNLARIYGTGDFRNTYDNTVLYNGVAIASDRFNGVYTLDLRDSDQSLYLLQNLNNLDSRVNTWTGLTNNQWDTADINWNNDQDKLFAPGDIVNFTSTEGTNRSPIQLTGNQEVSGMFISGNYNYTFNGGNLTAEKGTGHFTDPSIPANNGKLVFGQKANNNGTVAAAPYSGIADFSSITAEFKGGIDVQTGNLKLGDLGTATGDVTTAASTSIEFTKTAKVKSLTVGGKVIIGDVLNVTNNTDLSNATVSLDISAGAKIVSGGTVNLGGAIVVDLTVMPNSDTPYTLFTGDLGVTGFNTTSFTTRLNGSALSSRQSAQYSLGPTTGTPQSVLLTLNTQSIVNTWTGSTSRQWNTAASNWENTADLLFANGDIVNFTSTESVNRSPILLTGDTKTSVMFISGDYDYTFQGAALSADAANWTHTASRPDAANGKLILGSIAESDGSVSTKEFTGTADLTGLASATFKGGIEVNSGSLRLGNLGSSTGGVSVASAGSVEFTQDATISKLTASGKVILDEMLTVTGATTLTNAKLVVDTTQSARIESGTVSLDGNMVVDLNPTTQSSFNNYQLLVSDSIVSGFNSGMFTTFLNGQPLNTRQTALYTLSGDNKEVLLSIDTTNLALTWNAAAGSTWDINNTASWQTYSTSSRQFLNGDAAAFTGLGQGNVSVVSSGVKVADMFVSGGNYTFTGGRIDSTATSSLAPDVSEKLVVKGNSDAMFRNSGLNFAGGMELGTGATVVFGSQTEFTSATGDVNIANGSTVTFEAVVDRAGSTDSMLTGKISAKNINIGDATMQAKGNLSAIVGGQEVSSVVMAATDSLTFTPSARTSAEYLFYYYEFNQDGNYLKLNLTPKTEVDIEDFAYGDNSGALAGALDAALQAGLLDDIDGELRIALEDLFDSASAGEAAWRLSELTGAVLAGGSALAPAAAKTFRTALASLLRQQGIDLGSQGSLLEDSTWTDSNTANASLHRLPENLWHFRAVGLGEWSSANGQGNDPGYSAKEWGGMLAGFRRHGDLVFGVALDASHAKLTWDHNLGKTDGDTFASAIFASYRRDHFFATADVMLGTTEIKSRRELPSQNLQASADYRANWYGGDLYAGYQTEFCDWDIIPGAGVSVYSYHTPGVSETGAGTASLEMAKHHLISAEFTARVDVAKTYRFANGLAFRPRANLGLLVEAGNDRISPTVNFVGTTAVPAFAGYSLRAGRAAAQFGAGFDLMLTNHLSINADYQGEVRKNYQRHTGQAGVGVTF